MAWQGMGLRTIHKNKLTEITKKTIFSFHSPSHHIYSLTHTPQSRHRVREHSREMTKRDEGPRTNGTLPLYTVQRLPARRHMITKVQGSQDSVRTQTYPGLSLQSISKWLTFPSGVTVSAHGRGS
eukprot:6249658-Prymnesium_polylepis.1